MHKLFAHWHSLWPSSTSKQSLTKWIVHRTNQQPFPLHSQRKIFVTLSASTQRTRSLSKSQITYGKTLISSAVTSEVTLTKPEHSLSQTQLHLWDMKDSSSALNLNDAQTSSVKRNQAEDFDTISDWHKKLKTQETKLNVSQQFANMQQKLQDASEKLGINPASTSTNSSSDAVIVPYPEDYIIDQSFYRLEDKAERLSQILNSKRVWEVIPGNSKSEVNPESYHSRSGKVVDFKLMTYNLLAQELLETNCYLYHHCDRRVLNWGYRCKNLLQEMIEWGSDILCLQEMQINHYEEFFKPQMHRIGYDSIYKKRTGDKNDGCAIFYRRSKFYLDLQKEVEFNQPSVDLLDRDNIALIAVFRPILENGTICNKDEDPKLCVATTHLLFNPRRGDIKLAQLQILLAELDNIAFKKTSLTTGSPVYHPTILCGDMNSEPHSPLYKFVTKGRLNYHGLQIGNVSGQHEGINKGRRLGRKEIELSPLGITSSSQYETVSEDRSGFKNNQTDADAVTSEVVVDQLSHSFNMQSAYNHHDSNGCPYITTQHAKASCTVDYIFYSNQERCLSPKHPKEQSPKRSTRKNPLTLLGTYRLLSYLDVQTVGGLPNAVQSSDHLSLVAEFRFKVPNR